jgi:SAM-dependent methyltransferase
MSVIDEVRRFWDEDSEVYDDVPNHHPQDPAEQAAWTAALAALLPPPPARVLDCGAGTGFLSLLAARLGYEVTAIDVSAGMLSRLRAKADAAGVRIEVVEGPAEEPPSGTFDAVVERHLMWTLADPAAALKAWREAAPAGRLVLLEGLWGEADPFGPLRVLGRRLLSFGRPAPTGHHGEYAESLRASLPLGRGTSPAALARLVTEGGWGPPRLHRLRDVEWAATVSRRWPDRLIGVPPRFAVVAGS